MSCYCCEPMPAAVKSLMRMNFRFTPPKLPLMLNAALAIPPLADEAFNEKLALQVQGFPMMTLKAGVFGTISLAQKIKLALPALTIDGIPALEADLQNEADTFRKNVWPHLRFLTNFKMQPLLALSLAARLHLNLEKLLGIDPLRADLGEVPKAITHRFNASMSLPPIPKMRLIASLSPAIDLANQWDLDLGDRETPNIMSNRLMAISKIRPPSFQIPFPLLLKLSAMLEQIAVIQEAFGPDAMSPEGLRNISARLKLYNRFALPIPPIPFPLQANFKIPPPELPDLATGLKSPPGFASGLTTLPMRLSIAPVLDVMIALRLSMNLALDIEPISPCKTCACMAA